MIRSSSGRLALNAATVCGARSSSQRATKRMPAATISSTRENLPALRREANAECDEDDAGDEVESAPRGRNAQGRRRARDRTQPGQSQRREHEAVQRERGERRTELGQEAREEDRHLGVREVAQ